MEFEMNKAGVRIKKCCASCESRKDNIRTKSYKRTCRLGQTEPGRLTECDQWSMRKSLMDMKMNEGAVKSDKYFQFVLDIRSEERRLVEEYGKDKSSKKPRIKPTAEIRKKYIKMYGDPRN